jgi:hypothetical protein
MHGRHPAIRLALTCFVLVVVGVPATAFADGRSRAAALKKKGDEEMESLHYGEALEDYTQAYGLTHDPALLYNKARVLEALQRFADAVDELDRFAHDASPELRARVPKLMELRGELESHVASLIVRCGVEGARVLVRTQLVGTTPFPRPIRLNAGHAALQVLADGFAPYVQDIELRGGGKLEVDVKLVPNANSQKGELAVNATPEGSDVFVDGQPFGRSPAEGQVRPGRHEIVVSHAGFQEKRTFALVEGTDRRELTLALEKRPITSEWWFWAGAGAAVVGVAAVVVGVVVATHKPTPSKGTLGDYTTGAAITFP